MTSTHFEDRFLNAVHDVEVASVDAGRDFAHRVSDLAPVLAEDLTKVTDASFDFTGRMLELQLDVAHKVFELLRETEIEPPAARRRPSAAKKPAPAKKAA